MKLIENWKQAWRLRSVQLAGLLVFVDFTYEYLPVMQMYLPEAWVRWTGLAIIVARIVRQRMPSAPPKIEAKP